MATGAGSTTTGSTGAGSTGAGSTGAGSVVGIDGGRLGRPGGHGGGGDGDDDDRDRDRDEGAGDETSVVQRCSFLPARHALQRTAVEGLLRARSAQEHADRTSGHRMDQGIAQGAGMPVTRGQRTARRSGGSSVSGPVCVRLAARDCIPDAQTVDSPHSGRAPHPWVPGGYRSADARPPPRRPPPGSTRDRPDLLGHAQARLHRDYEVVLLEGDAADEAGLERRPALARSRSSAKPHLPAERARAGRGPCGS